MTLGPIVQGERGTLSFTWKFDVASPATIQAATITAVMRNKGTGAVTAVTGTLTGVDADTVEWALSAGDSGTPGKYAVFFQAVVSGVLTYTYSDSLLIVEHPSATAVQNPALVGITPALAAWLAAEKTAIEAVTDGELLQSDGDNSEGSGIVAANVVVDADLSAHTDLTVTAHGGILPEDAGIVAVASGRDLLSTDAGKILECDGTFTVTCPNGLDAGFQCVLVNVGTGTITVAATTTLQSDGTLLATQYTGATIYHRGSNVWLAMGRLT